MNDERPYDPSRYTLADIVRSLVPAQDPKHPHRKPQTQGQVAAKRRRAGKKRAAQAGSSVQLRQKP